MGETLEIEPFLVILLLSGVLLLFAVIALYLWKKRAEQAGQLRFDVDDLLAGYEGENPAFVRIMQVYRSNESLDLLLENPEVEAALSELAIRKAESVKNKKKVRKDLGRSLLELSRPGARDTRSQAVMMTILRSIYSDPRLRNSLPPSAEEELDALLDSLTGRDPIR